jgi:hypothetical protein
VLREVERVARGGKDGIDHHRADRPMVRVVHPLVVDEEDRWIVAHHDLGSKLPDRPGDALPEPQARLHLPIRLAQEVDPGHPDLGGGGPLLLLPQGGQGRWIG